MNKDIVAKHNFPMEIKVVVHPGSNKRKIEESKSSLSVYLKSDPKGGAANDELLSILSDYYNVPLERVHLVKGFKSHRKVVQIS